MAAVEVKPSPEGVPGAVTDPARIAAETLTYAGAGKEQVNAYLARPAEGGSHPAVIVIHEASGVTDHTRDVSNRFANIGYVALAVDLYTREGGPPPMDDLQKVMERLFSLPDSRVLGDLEGAADYLRDREDVTGRIGCIGFCMGGRYTLLFACSSDRLNAAVDCWGGFIDKATPDERSTPERPVPPLELAEGLRCPLLAAIGAEDQNPSPEIGAQLLERARRSGQEVKVDVYEGAGHAFFADYRPTYRPEPAAKLWREIVPFFARHLQAD
ncbi:MAG TPA: dienelactone hydrolase family protein [Solirubrobacteraceae bacterium]|jgi:carboxymethylenebutenolidase|nr:dienelactone hydrolase family protein [Solirubrobacteraceae bacterium]